MLRTHPRDVLTVQMGSFAVESLCSDEANKRRLIELDARAVLTTVIDNGNTENYVTNALRRLD